VEVIPYDRPVPKAHVCVAVVLRHLGGEAFTLCDYGHLVMAQSRVSPFQWDNHLRELHERTLTGRIGEPEPPSPQEGE
jgi:hypothetical protein